MCKTCIMGLFKKYSQPFRGTPNNRSTDPQEVYGPPLGYEPTV